MMTYSENNYSENTSNNSMVSTLIQCSMQWHNSSQW